MFLWLYFDLLVNEYFLIYCLKNVNNTFFVCVYRFQLCFKSKEPLTAILEVVENNPFRLLCHVSLNFSMGNDSDVKAYLADCLTKLKDQHIKLSTIYEQTKSDLTAKLDNAQKVNIRHY
jgi:hypothetical protein